MLVMVEASVIEDDERDSFQLFIKKRMSVETHNVTPQNIGGC